MWQVGPTGRARTRSASPSQSIRTSTVSSVFPEVSPLRQKASRLRLQNHVRPVANVNTKEDELHPSLAPNGKALYFSRKTKDGWKQMMASRTETKGPGGWQEPKEVGLPVGFHHAALYCEDYDATRAAYTTKGAEVAFEGLMMGHRTCWIDTTKTLGFMVELMTSESEPAREGKYGEQRDSSRVEERAEAARTVV